MPSTRPPSPAPLAALLALALAGCAHIGGAQARYSYLQSKLEGYRFEKPCDELWPAALRIPSAKGFPLVGSDRELVGEASEGFFSKLISDGFSTHSTAAGGLVCETNWKENTGTRYRIEGTPVEPKGCRVAYLQISGGAQGDNQFTSGPDWNMLLDLVAVLDPDSAAKIEAGAPPD